MKSAEMKFVNFDNTDVIATSTPIVSDGITVKNIADGIGGNASVIGTLNGVTINYNPDGVAKFGDYANVVSELSKAISGVRMNTKFYGKDDSTGVELMTLFSIGGLDRDDGASESTQNKYNVFYVWDAASRAFRYNQ